MKIVRFILSISILLLPSCSNRTLQVEKGQVLLVPPIEISDDIPLSEIVSLEKYTPLETTEDAIVGELSKLLTTENYYIILDNLTQSVFVYNRSTGKLISHIKKTGGGLGEYDRILDIAYDRKKNDVYILSSSKVLVYSCFGDFIREVSLKGIFASYVETVSDGLLALSPNFSRNVIDGEVITSNLLVVNNQLQLKQNFMDFHSPIYSYNTVSPMSNNGNEFLFINRYDDNIYQLEEGKLQIKYSIDYGNDNSLIGDRIVQSLHSPEVSPTDGMKLEDELGYCAMQQWINMNDYLYWVYRKGMVYNYVFYSKISGYIQCYSSDLMKKEAPVPFVNDFDGNPFYFFIAGYGDDILLSYALPDDLLKGEVKNPLLEEIKKELIPDDNFVIVEFKIK